MEEVKMNRNRMGRVGEMCQERRRGIKVSDKKKRERVREGGKEEMKRKAQRQTEKEDEE